MEIIDFIFNKVPFYTDKEQIEDIVKRHIEYGTFDYEVDEKGFVYCVRYNISKTGLIADVLDLCVRDGESFKLIKYIIMKNVARWPSLRAIKFNRFKYKERSRVYKIEDILKKEIQWDQQR
jgi:hypothetical protein